MSNLSLPQTHANVSILTIRRRQYDAAQSEKMSFASLRRVVWALVETEESAFLDSSAHL